MALLLRLKIEFENLCSQKRQESITCDYVVIAVFRISVHGGPVVPFRYFFRVRLVAFELHCTQVFQLVDHGGKGDDLTRPGLVIENEVPLEDLLEEMKVQGCFHGVSPLIPRLQLMDERSLAFAQL